jgi:hypothetical protein
MDWAENGRYKLRSIMAIEPFLSMSERDKLIAEAKFWEDMYDQAMKINHDLHMLQTPIYILEKAK